MTDSRRGLLTLVATILGSTIVFLDATVVNVALPAISDDLDTGLADQQWVVEAYLLALVTLLLVGGSLGDQFGRRRIFLIGLVGFGITSALCAIAPNSETLIGARAAQGLAGALLVPGSLAILAATFEGPARGKAVGTWTAWSGIATVLGPAGGGALIEARLATTPVSVMLFVLSPRFGRIATDTGPRVPMCVGPIVGGFGLLLLMRVDAGASYVTDVLPGVVVFGLGLSATVAPLTATALDSVPERHVGIASGINNGVSRVAGLLAIAVLGAVIAGSFDSKIDDRLAGERLSVAAERSVERAKEKPFGAAN